MAKHYTEELVYTEAEDGIILAGLVIQPAAEPVKRTAVVWIPGLSIHFYHPSFIPIGRELAGLGFTFVIGNHRGHDIGANLWRKQRMGKGWCQRTAAPCGNALRNPRVTWRPGSTSRHTWAYNKM